MDRMMEPSFARCVSPVPIRCRGPIHFYSGRDPDSAQPRVIAAAPRLPRGEARARLAGLAHFHRLAAGDHVACVVDLDLDGPVPWVALGCDAIADLETVGDFIHHGGDRPSFALGAMLGKTIMETLIRTHRVTDPVTGGPVCLGSLALANVQVAADGRLWLVGFGAGSLADACIAPEVASGGAPTPGADVFAVMLFMRAQIAFAELPPALVRVFAGRPLDSDAELMRLLVWSNAQILAAPPAGRPSMAEALDRAWQMWRLLGFAPDTAGFAAWLARAIAIGPDAEPVPAVDADRSRIVVGRDGEWIEANGIRHRLASRRPLRRLLFA